MKIHKILYYFLIVVMFFGGVMGLVKGLVPNMTWFNFRHLMGLGGTFNEHIPIYAVIYGVIMAVLEIISSILLLSKNKIAIYFTIAILGINALGCIIAILIGDIMAIGSLLTRFFAIYILMKAKKYRFIETIY